jgi:cation:H+ antiporter
MLLVFWFLILVVFSILLIRAADFAVYSLKKISLKLKVSVFVASAIIVALGTGLPEIVVAITSALEGRPSLSLGNVLGANIVNISLVVGLSAFILGGVNLRVLNFKREVRFVWIAALLLLLLMSDGVVSRVDGLILIFTYAVYITLFLSQGESKEEHISFGRHFFKPHFEVVNHMDFKLAEELVKLFVSFGVLLFSAEMIVKSAVNLTSFLNFSVFDVGLIFIAVGTTLPELAFSIRSIKDHQPSMFLGTIFGSLVANWTLIVGIAASIFPIFVESFFSYFSPLLYFAIIFIVFRYFLKSKNRIERWEAAVLLSFYIIFLIIEFA